MSTKKIVVFLLTILLAVIPFFWLKPGELNLGGDSSRGYLYQPFLFITNYSLYGINPWNIGTEMVGYFLIPFSAFLGSIFVALKTSHNLINFFNSFSFVLAFVGTYGSIYSMLKDADKSSNKNLGFARTAGIIGGLFYLFSPSMTNWDKPLLTFNHVFLDPIMFFFLYKYLSTKKVFYAFIAILTTFIFAPNFSFIGAPTFFSFYPFVLLFFTAWIYLVKRSSINFKQVFLLLILFLGVHAFQLLPQIFVISNPASIAAKRVFSDPTFNYVGYFKSTVVGVNATYNFLGLPQYNLSYGILFFIFPFIIIFSLLQKVKNNSEAFYRKTYIILIICFLILLFFTSGKITNVGMQFYANLFNIPGFGMFRNFTGQFITAFSFFYSLVLGFGLYILYKKLNKRVSIIISFFIFFLLVVRGWPLINGSILYLPTFMSKVSTPYIPTKNFENALSYISKIPTDSKILNLPLNDFGYLMVPGENGGLFMGSSIIGPLSLKKDFQNYTGMGDLGLTFINAIKTKDIKAINNTISILNIHDVFWEKNPFIYSTNFPNFPYISTQIYIDTSVQAYDSFVSLLPILSIKNFGKDIQILHLNKIDSLPKIFASRDVVYTNNTFVAPFLVEKGKNKSNIVISPQSDSISFNSVTYQADLHDEFSTLNDNLQFHKAVPEVSWKPGSLFYPLVVWKEERSLKRQQGQDKMIFGYLYLSKRIEELGKWGKYIPILNTKITLPDPSPISVLQWYRYNSWEAVLNLYNDYASQMIDSIGQFPKDQIKAQKVQAYEQFEQHRLRIEGDIGNIDTTDENRSYLINVTDKMFDNLEDKLNVEKLDSENIQFTLALPKGAQGIYDIQLSHTFPEVVYNSINLNGNTFDPLKKEGDTYSFDQSYLTPEKQIFMNLSQSTKNLANDTKWEGLGRIETVNNTESITIDSSFNNFSRIMVKQLPLVKNTNQYFVSFLYNTHKIPFNVTLIDKRKRGQNQIDSHMYMTRKLFSNDWKLFQTVYTVDPATKAVYLQIDNLGGIEDKEIVLKNFKLTAIEYPILTVKKVNSVSNVPDIEFQRINPTKYRVFVKNSSGPFALTFLEAFSQNWKLYLAKSLEKRNLPIVESYLEGKVLERNHKNLFLSNSTTETWDKSPIADFNHFMGDGYANSWIINPKDVGGKSSYDLIIELQTQKYFYLSSIISIISLLGMLVWQILDLFNKKKIPNEN